MVFSPALPVDAPSGSGVFQCIPGMQHLFFLQPLAPFKSVVDPPRELSNVSPEFGFSLCHDSLVLP